MHLWTAVWNMDCRYFSKIIQNYFDTKSVKTETLLWFMVRKQDQGALACRIPVGPYNWPLNPIQYPGLTVSFRNFIFVLIDLLSPVKW